MRTPSAIATSIAVTVTALTALDAGATDIPAGPVSGTWDVAGSPYVVLGDITVPAGETLVIDPGVEVRVEGDYRITALGSIEAVGTPTDSIHIAGVPAFDSIRLENETETSHFAYCRIGNADTGINSILSPVEVVSCRLHDHVTAIDVFGIGDPTPPVVRIEDSLIERCQRHGIFVVENSNTIIEGCEITACALDGSPRGAIQLSNQSAGGANDPVIQTCWIHDNVWQGITAFDLTGQGNIRPLVSGNVIERNLTGIYLLHASGRLEDNEIRDNFEAGNPNSGAGVMVAGSASVPVVVGNTLTGNFTAFYVIDGARPNLGELGDGDPTNDGMNRMFDNTDLDGDTWTVYSLSTEDIKAENNAWGSEDPVAIAVTIFDVHDDPSVGEVDFEPLLDAVGVAGPVSPGSRGRMLAAPNPFRAGTTFDLGPSAGNASIEITVHDVAGRTIRTLVGDPGDRVTWDGRDARGRPVPPGTYFARRSDRDDAVARLVVLR